MLYCAFWQLPNFSICGTKKNHTISFLLITFASMKFDWFKVWQLVCVSTIWLQNMFEWLKFRWLCDLVFFTVQRIICCGDLFQLTWDGYWSRVYDLQNLKLKIIASDAVTFHWKRKRNFSFHRIISWIFSFKSQCACVFVNSTVLTIRHGPNMCSISTQAQFTHC